MNYDEIKDASAGSWFGEKFKDEHLPTFDDVVKIANEYEFKCRIKRYYWTEWTSTF